MLTFLNIDALTFQTIKDGTSEVIVLNFYQLIETGFGGDAECTMLFMAYILGILIGGYGVACVFLQIFRPFRKNELTFNILFLVFSIYNVFIGEFIGELVTSQLLLQGYDTVNYKVGTALISWIGTNIIIGVLLLVCATINAILSKKLDKDEISKKVEKI